MKRFSIDQADRLGGSDGGDKLYEYVKSRVTSRPCRGDANARAFLGICYDHGYGVEQDREKAVGLYREAAVCDSDIGGFLYAYSLQYGHGTETDTELARALYERLAKKGEPAAMYQYATLCDGDDKLAWLEKAADKGHALAAVMLGDLRRSGGLEDAMECYQRAADLGSCEALCRLALCYLEKGDEDRCYDQMAKAVGYSREASMPVRHEKPRFLSGLRRKDLSYDPVIGACKSLGDRFAHGPGGRSDPARAMAFYETALERIWNEPRCHSLASDEYGCLVGLVSLYRNGITEPREGGNEARLCPRALQILQQGDVPSRRIGGVLCYLGAIHLWGIDTKRDSQTAVTYLKEAIEKLDREADGELLSFCEYCLGLCHYLGDGVPLDMAKAREHWARGVEQGGRACLVALAHLYESDRDLSKASELYGRYLAEGLELTGADSTDRAIRELIEIRDRLRQADRIRTLKTVKRRYQSELESLQKKIAVEDLGQKAVDACEENMDGFSSFGTKLDNAIS